MNTLLKAPTLITNGTDTYIATFLDILPHSETQNETWQAYLLDFSQTEPKVALDFPILCKKQDFKVVMRNEKQTLQILESLLVILAGNYKTANERANVTAIDLKKLSSEVSLVTDILQYQMYPISSLMFDASKSGIYTQEMASTYSNLIEAFEDDEDDDLEGDVNSDITVLENTKLPTGDIYLAYFGAKSDSYLDYIEMEKEFTLACKKAA